MRKQVMVALNKAYAAKRGGGTIAGYHELHLLDTGAIVIMDEENNILPSTVVADDIVKVSQFRIAQGEASQDRTPKQSILIDRDAFTQWYNTYEAPVTQISRLGKVATVGTLGLPGTLLSGTFASLVVVDTTAGDYRTGQTKRYTVPVYSTDTATTILTRLSAAVNADVNRVVNATILNDASNDYIQLTALTASTTFKIAGDDLLVNATRNEDGTGGSTNSFDGFGTIAKVKEALKEDALTRGENFRNLSTDLNWYSVGTVLDGDTSSTFNGWTFQFKSEAQRGNRVVQVDTPVVALFMVVGGAGNTAINTIINAILQVPDSNAGTSPSGISSGEGTTVDDIPAGGEG